MRILVVAFAIALLCGAGLGQRKPPEVQVVETRASREEGKILIDGVVRCSAAKPLRGLIVYFDLLNAENGVVATENAVLEEDVIEPQQERSYHSATSDHARAVRFRVRASDKDVRELRVANGGPFPIE